MRLSLLCMTTVSLLTLGACNRIPRADEGAAAMQADTAVERRAAISEPSSKGKIATPVRENPALSVESEGLRLFDPKTGSARAMAFGMPRSQVLAALAFRGMPDTGTNGECGAGPLQYANWPDGLGLFFQNDKFAGWNANERGQSAIATASGVGPGTTRAELEAAYKAEFAETTLGTEFSAGGLYGILDGREEAAKITNMWAGVSCNFR